jgi:hypothetical protein
MFAVKAAERFKVKGLVTAGSNEAGAAADSGPSHSR